MFFSLFCSVAGVMVPSSMLHTKDLAGEPAHFALHDLPSPEHAAVTARGVMMRATLEDAVSGVNFQVGPGRTEMFTLSVFTGKFSGSSESDIRLVVTSPNGTVFLPKKVVQETLGFNSATGQDCTSFSYANPPISSGFWTVSVVADQIAQARLPSEVLILLSVATDTFLVSVLDTHDFVVGQPVPFRSRVSSVTSTLDAPHCNATLVVRGPSGASSSQPMTPVAYPRGADTLSNRSDFEAEIIAGEAGLYDTEVRLKGVTVEGQPFERVTWHSFRVVAETVSLRSEPAMTSWEEVEGGCGEDVAEEEGLSLSSLPWTFRHRLLVDIPVWVHDGRQTRYLVFAQLWGTSVSGAPVPIAWLTKIATLHLLGHDSHFRNLSGHDSHFRNLSGHDSQFRNLSGHRRRGRFRLRVDVRWLVRASVDWRQPITLRELRIQELANFIPVATANEMLVLNSDWTAEHHARLAESRWPHPGGATEVTPIMRAGCKPKSRVSNQPRDGMVSLALVHGYCASSCPFVTSDFSDYAVFEDFGQARSTDTFAQRVGEFIGGVGAVSVVAHSQGGLAALHLSTYYWSNLDEPATSGLKLQSVGSPYQGCPLAGLLASVGSIFGAGCGQDEDLTYDGAQRWLAGIPVTSQAEVAYTSAQYSTSGSLFDHFCNLAANTVLEWPNDGCVEVSKAVLPGGMFDGNIEGECHTQDMHFPAECRDAATNRMLNSRARRHL